MENLPKELIFIILEYVSDTDKYCLKLVSHYFLNLLADIRVNDKIKIEILTKKANFYKNQIAVIQDRLAIPCADAELNKLVHVIFAYYSHLFDEKYINRVLTGIHGFLNKINNSFKFRYNCKNDPYKKRCTFCDTDHSASPHCIKLTTNYRTNKWYGHMYRIEYDISVLKNVCICERKLTKPYIFERFLQSKKFFAKAKKPR